MVYKITEGKRGIFVESLILTLIIFVVGFSIGFFVENHRTDKIIKDYKEYEVEALDLKLQNYYYQIMNKQACDSAIKQNFVFADKLYSKGLVLEKYEEANQISDELTLEKKRYVLLKTELWLNTLLLKEKCVANFSTVVYFYSADPGNSAKVAEQKVISNVLKTVKENKGNEIVLLPIAGDMKLDAVTLQMNVYGVEKLPSILIDEHTIIEGFSSVEEIERALGAQNRETIFLN